MAASAFTPIQSMPTSAIFVADLLIVQVTIPRRKLIIQVACRLAGKLRFPCCSTRGKSEDLMAGGVSTIDADGDMSQSRRWLCAAQATPASVNHFPRSAEAGAELARDMHGRRIGGQWFRGEPSLTRT